ncbi:MAG: hypothetical protein WD316_12895 [Phycisphaeraceae bacterium]
MTGRDLATIVCRLLALYLFAMALLRSDWVVALVWTVSALGENGMDMRGRVTAFAAAFVPPLLVLAAGVVLWLGAPRLGDRLAGSAADAPLPTQIDARTGQAMLFAVAGVIMIAVGVSELIYPFAQWAYADPELTPLDYGWGASLASRGLLVVIGVVLLLGGRGFAGLITRMRTFATPAEKR